MQIIFFFLAWLCTAIAHAKQFSNSYCSFWVPEDWKCELEETEYICRPIGNSDASKEVLLIVTAKYTGAQDSIAQYIDHLGRDHDGDGPARVSIAPRLIRLGERLWVDATHKGSEIPNYFTRYLATVDGPVAILFTVSFYHTDVSKYRNIIEQIAVSVRSSKLAVGR
jgi:hypothetical protein